MSPDSQLRDLAIVLRYVPESIRDIACFHAGLNTIHVNNVIASVLSGPAPAPIEWPDPNRATTPAQLHTMQIEAEQGR